jgi:NADP-dependent aldehyde dehydrogenase
VVSFDAMAVTTAPRTFHALNPATGEPLGTYVEATPAEVRAAVDAARVAFDAGALLRPGAREGLLRGAAARLRAAADEIAAVCATETGLSETRVRGELERTAGQLEAFAGLVAEGDLVEAIIDHADPAAQPVPRPDVRRMLVPLGPVAVFGASNFPLAFSVAGGDTASALAAGCPVVVKGHPSHPGTGAVVARELSAAVAEAGLPPGVFALLQAAGVEVGEALVDEPAIAAVGFTGSLAGGRALADRAAARPQPIPVYAEMGSVNPVVITEGALVARGAAIAQGLTAAVATHGGQLCTKPGVVFVPASAAGDAFAADVAARLQAAGPQVLLGPGIHERFTAGTAALPAERLTTAPGDLGPGCRAAPAAFRARASELKGRPELLEEHFGPAVVLLAYADAAELLEALGRLEGQLAAAIHAQPEEAELSTRLSAALAARVGRVVFDGFPTGVVVCHAQHHGGPYPATSSALHTSVGLTAARRWLRPVAFQDAPAHVLPAALRDGNPRGIWRRVDGELTRGR